MSEEDSSIRSDIIEEDDDSIRIRYDWDTAEPSTAFAETIAIAKDRAANEIEPLYSYVDPESLNALISPRRGDGLGTTNSISFEYGTQDVTVRGNGEVSVQKDGSE